MGLRFPPPPMPKKVPRIVSANFRKIFKMVTIFFANLARNMEISQNYYYRGLVPGASGFLWSCSNFSSFLISIKMRGLLPYPHWKILSTIAVRWQSWIMQLFRFLPIVCFFCFEEWFYNLLHSGPCFKSFLGSRNTYSQELVFRLRHIFENSSNNRKYFGIAVERDKDSSSSQRQSLFFEINYWKWKLKLTDITRWTFIYTKKRKPQTRERELIICILSKILQDRGKSLAL